MKIGFGKLFSLLVALTLAVPLAVIAQEAPDALIKRLSDEILETIKSDAALKAGDNRKINALVDTKVMPHVNFERMTGRAVGRSWANASPQQREQLMTEFRALLLRTYSGALSSVGDQQVRMRPLRTSSEDTDVVVRSQVLQPRGEPVQLDYRMHKVGDQWKIYDVNVLGVWLVDTYREQFAQQVSSGGIDGLIKSLSERNRQSDAGRASEAGKTSS